MNALEAREKTELRFKQLHETDVICVNRNIMPVIHDSISEAINKGEYSTQYVLDYNARIDNLLVLILQELKNNNYKVIEFHNCDENDMLERSYRLTISWE